MKHIKTSKEFDINIASSMISSIISALISSVYAVVLSEEKQTLNALVKALKDRIFLLLLLFWAAEKICKNHS